MLTVTMINVPNITITATVNTGLELTGANIGSSSNSAFSEIEIYN